MSATYSQTTKRALLAGGLSLFAIGAWIADFRASPQPVHSKSAGPQPGAQKSASQLTTAAQAQPLTKQDSPQALTDAQDDSTEGTPRLVVEGQFMVDIRKLWVKDPLSALAQVRKGDQDFASGPGAAERGWIAARCLTALGRHEEAQVEARRLVAEFPGTHWANDAERHLLIHPHGLPSREARQRETTQRAQKQ